MKLNNNEDDANLRAPVVVATSDRTGKGNVVASKERSLTRTKAPKKPLVQSYTSCEAMKPNSNDDDDAIANVELVDVELEVLLGIFGVDSHLAIKYTLYDTEGHAALPLLRWSTGTARCFIPCQARHNARTLLSHVELLRQDQHRVDYIHHRAANSTARLNPIGSSIFAEVSVEIGIPLSSYNYIVTIGLGTQIENFSVLLDTGSPLTWIQCVPCDNCYPQIVPIYDPAKSFGFSNIPCNSNYCADLNQFGCSSTDTCLYVINYFDGSFSKGSFIKDTLTFSSDKLLYFRYGCGHNNSWTFGQINGILGLGRGAVSIISQTAGFYNKVFSYCLPSATNKIGYLKLGSSVPSVQYTPMLTNPNLPSMYFLNLIAISVDHERLNLSPTVFTGPGTFLDSGAVISRLPPTAYFALRDTFQQYMTKYPMVPPIEIFDTCYDFTNFQNVSLPQIDLIFEGEVTVTLDSTGIIFTTTTSITCFAFAKNDDDSKVVIIGNVQQRTKNIVIDEKNQQIGFGAHGCS
ncbi:aspartyl protease family protein At5g10770-like [Dendrobium catenatum]|uniref:aspartyl protease family protein At5g10770-like n=1 Tax=Dendrobium catenatum TaxID=906689 RepID=UPI00109F4D1A|nr:aspartyl protease family protein At5g10770-like [Dendrobium catenatum]